jgi:hypothetical protein
VTEERLETDREKIEEAVGIFRARANLHANADAPALIRWAHENGKSKPYADMVRTAWHDFENGRRYNDLPVHRYEIRYERQADLFKPPPIGDARPSDEKKGSNSDPPPDGQTPDPEPDIQDERLTSQSPLPVLPRRRSPGPCEHKGRVNDGKSIVCDDCGEVLEELPDCAHEGTKVRGHEDPTRWVCTACGEDVGEAPPEIKPEEPEPEPEPEPADDQEVLF